MTNFEIIFFIILCLVVLIIIAVHFLLKASLLRKKYFFAKITLKPINYKILNDEKIPSDFSQNEWEKHLKFKKKEYIFNEISKVIKMLNDTGVSLGDRIIMNSIVAYGTAEQLIKSAIVPGIDHIHVEKE
jgi:hypothetical protein